ncbi:MAG: hypothetical protein IJ767_00040 [Bacteroidaceae bacterium]|nr:hypothetical protein [Bacteroidaceae bacterium]
MADKIIQLTTQQLSDLVSEAVEHAIKRLDNVRIIESSDNQTEDSSDVRVGEFSEEQYREAMATMAANRGAGNEPKVGLFWYSISEKQLFGVVTHKRTDYLKPNAGGGLITCSEMHEDVWKKEFYKQKFHKNGVGPFKGEYQFRPRGRVFYSPAKDQYIIAVGSWIDQHPEAIDLVLEEFDLPRDKTIVQKASHWDIGQTWND